MLNFTISRDYYDTETKVYRLCARWCNIFNC